MTGLYLPNSDSVLHRNQKIHKHDRHVGNCAYISVFNQ